MSIAVRASRLPGYALCAGDRLSLRVRGRPVVAALGLALAGMALFVLAVATGDLPLSAADVIAGITGQADAGTTFIVRDLRLPRALCAVLVGAALGVSGAIFQSLTRNPLGSPDIIGFEQGASVGALVVITILAGSGALVAGGALGGGALTAASVYLLAFRRGGASGYRLILVGIAISFLMGSITTFLLARANRYEAVEAVRWLLGSLNGRDWDDVVPLAVALALIVPFLAPAGRALRALEVGDDAAHGLGVRVERARLALIAIGVALVSVSTVAAGPVLFVALTAPQIARRLARTPGPPIVCAALTGILVMLAADIAAQRLIPSATLPLGVMTGAFGGLYLAWLLMAGWRAGRA